MRLFLLHETSKCLFYDDFSAFYYLVCIYNIICLFLEAIAYVFGERSLESPNVKGPMGVICETIWLWVCLLFAQNLQIYNIRAEIDDESCKKTDFGVSLLQLGI